MITLEQLRKGGKYIRRDVASSPYAEDHRTTNGTHVSIYTPKARMHSTHAHTRARTHTEKKQAVISVWEAAEAGRMGNLQHETPVLGKKKVVTLMSSASTLKIKTKNQKKPSFCADLQKKIIPVIGYEKNSSLRMGYTF